MSSSSVASTNMHHHTMPGEPDLLTDCLYRWHNCLCCRLAAGGCRPELVHPDDRGRPEQCRRSNHYVPRLLSGTSRAQQHDKPLLQDQQVCGPGGP
jgi:hypothetical protein